MPQKLLLPHKFSFMKHIKHIMKPALKITAFLQKATDKKHKYKVTLVFSRNGEEHIKTVKFGAIGYSDFTKHHDTKRRSRYDKRHKQKENWTKSGITTAGFWSKKLLWWKPSIPESIKAIEKKYGIKIHAQRKKKIRNQ